MSELLQRIERYYDTVPRVAAGSEEVGPFTMFVPLPGTGATYYARPRLGLEETVTHDDVCRVLARQQALGLPGAVEWVDETTPSLRPAVTGLVASPVGNQRELLGSGLLRIVGAYDDTGTRVGGGTSAPREAVAELMGIGVLPRARRSGLGAAIAAGLADDARDRGVETVFLSAQDDAVARVSERVGFRRTATACMLELR